jgi:dGTPase
MLAAVRVRMDGVSAPAVDTGFETRIRAWEDDALAPQATRSYPAERERPEEECGLRTPFQRDRDRIVHCKAFRRLKHKTQVFVAPEGDHYRTRLTHTLETTQISRTVARALRLNEDLTEAIGLGHDLGHPPFGHIGEDVLDRAGRERFGRGFRHNEHSLRVVEVLERLNLTAPVRDGILRHSSGAGEPATLEGKIVRLVDRIAYINHDIDDALRAGVIALDDLPGDEIAILGDTGSRRIDALVHDLVEHSARAGDIVQGDAVGPAMLRLRTFMFERVYLGPTARAEHVKIERVVRGLFDWYAEHPDALPEGVEGASHADRVIDYLAGMTDRFAIRAWQDRFVPQGLAS